MGEMVSLSLMDQIVSKIESDFPDFPKKDLHNLKVALAWAYILKQKGDKIQDFPDKKEIDFEELFSIFQIPQNYRKVLVFIY